MKRYEELASKLNNVDKAKKGFILSLLKDFVWLEEQINELRKYPRYTIDPKNPKRQIKLEVHNMLKDYQAQKDDIATKILRSLDKETVVESTLLKVLERFE